MLNRRFVVTLGSLPVEKNIVIRLEKSSHFSKWFIYKNV